MVRENRYKELRDFWSRLLFIYLFIYLIIIKNSSVIRTYQGSKNCKKSYGVPLAFFKFLVDFFLLNCYCLMVGIY